jgi:hypothetical protein
LGGGRNATTLNYSGSTYAIACTNTNGIPPGSESSGAIDALTLNGASAGASAVGIYIESCIGEHLDQLSIQGFGSSNGGTTTTGAGIELDNENSLWTERTFIGDVIADNGGPDIWFHVGNGNNSFGYTTIVGAHLDNRALEIDSGATLYGGFVQFSSNTGAVPLIDVKSGGVIADCFFAVLAENTNQLSSSYSVEVEQGGSFEAEGMFKGDYLSVLNNGRFSFYGHGDHADPGQTSYGLYGTDSTTKLVATDDSTYPNAVWAISGSAGYNQGNAVLMLNNTYSDGRSGLRILNGLTATSPQVASIDNSGVLILQTSGLPHPAPIGGVAFTSKTTVGASTGSNGTLPSAVQGYLIINISGVNYKIPYYNN